MISNFTIKAIGKALRNIHLSIFAAQNEIILKNLKLTRSYIALLIINKQHTHGMKKEEK